MKLGFCYIQLLIKVLDKADILQDTSYVYLGGG